MLHRVRIKSEKRNVMDNDMKYLLTSLIIYAIGAIIICLLKFYAGLIIIGFGVFIALFKYFRSND